MKKVTSILAISIFSFVMLTSCGDKKYASTKLKTEVDTVCYYLGVGYGSGVKQANIDSLFNYDAFMKGVKDAMKEDTLPVSQFVMQTYLNEFFSKYQEEQVKKQFKDYIRENEDFLARNSKKDSVVSLPSGIQYVVIKEGNGNKPTTNDKIKVHYTGKLIDGTIFDSSYQRNEPAEFMVGEVIPGWVEVLQLMPVGSHWRVYIPQNLAYGSRPPRQSTIKPFSTLIFEVELLDIVPVNQQ